MIRKPLHTHLDDSLADLPGPRFAIAAAAVEARLSWALELVARTVGHRWIDEPFSGAEALPEAGAGSGEPLDVLILGARSAVPGEPVEVRLLRAEAWAQHAAARGCKRLMVLFDSATDAAGLEERLAAHYPGEATDWLFSDWVWGGEREGPLERSLRRLAAGHDVVVPGAGVRPAPVHLDDLACAPIAALLRAPAALALGADAHREAGPLLEELRERLVEVAAGSGLAIGSVRRSTVQQAGGPIAERLQPTPWLQEVPVTVPLHSEAFQFLLEGTVADALAERGTVGAFRHEGRWVRLAMEPGTIAADRAEGACSFLPVTAGDPFRLSWSAWRAEAEACDPKGFGLRALVESALAAGYTGSWVGQAVDLVGRHARLAASGGRHP